MSDRGIIFSAAMVRALLAGRKTQTRRLAKTDAPHFLDPNYGARWVTRYEHGKIVERSYTPGAPRPDLAFKYSIRIKPADRLYVREACNTDWCDSVLYRADGGSARDAGYASEPKWRPSIHMPRWASRMTLLVRQVRVQRLQDISEEDALAEGTPCHVCGGAMPSEDDCHCFHRQDARVDFEHLWNSLHDKPGERWEDNPWLYALTFDVVHQNIDRIAA